MSIAISREELQQKIEVNPEAVERGVDILGDKLHDIAYGIREEIYPSDDDEEDTDISSKGYEYLEKLVIMKYLERLNAK